MSTLKLAASVAAVLFATACERKESKLDSVTQKAPAIGADSRGGGGAANSAEITQLKQALQMFDQRQQMLEDKQRELQEQLNKYQTPLNVLQTAYDREKGNLKVGTDNPMDMVNGRLKTLEENLAKREEALAFLDLAYASQKAQREAQEAQEPDPNAVFAVNIDAPIKAGQVEGSANALVTIVEAWDFA